MLRIHLQRHIAEWARAKLRGLIGLNVAHDRIHIHDDHVLFLTHHSRKENELAILGFDARRMLAQEGFAFLDVFKIHDHITKLSDEPTLKGWSSRHPWPSGILPQ